MRQSLSLNAEISPEVRDLQALVHGHPAAALLKTFEQKLMAEPLDARRLRLLLASEGAFVLEVPPGIVALSSRVTDQYFKTNPFGSTGVGALVLFAAVDEFGLADAECGPDASHHELYARMAAHWDIDEQALVAPENVIPEASGFARVVREYYRERPIAEALGFHVANETTAPLDFGMLYRTFRELRAHYRLRDDDPALAFLAVHDEVEDSHAKAGLLMVERYRRDHGDEVLSAARVGVDAYMQAYFTMFSCLMNALFK